MSMRLLFEVLAGYRILRLIQIDDITRPYREATHRFMTRHQRLKGWRPLLECPWCLGMWVAFGVAAANAYGGELWQSMAKILSLSLVIGFLGYLDQEHIR